MWHSINQRCKDSLIFLPQEGATVDPFAQLRAPAIITFAAKIWPPSGALLPYRKALDGESKLSHIR